jgi:hypothetical protein
MNFKQLRKYLLIFALIFTFFSMVTSCKSTAKEVVPSAQIPAEAVNKNPVITALKGNPQIPPLGQTLIVCEANDPDGDNLSYRWSATGGSISGSASEVTWTAPQKPGSYMISVVVSDNKGGTANKDLIINVPEKPNHAPVIEGIQFTRPGHMPTMVKPNMTEKEKKSNPEPVIRIFETADITCLASDPDGDKLDFIWMASGGKINSIPGKQDSVQWIVPGAAGTYKITCEVSDPDGLTDTFTITVTVKCCGV